MRVFRLVVVLPILMAAPSAQTGGKQFVRPLPGQTPPYSLGIKAGGVIYLAGQLPTDEKGALVQGDIATQAKQVFEQVWPTQPFPTKPPPFARQSFTAADINPRMLTSAERERFTRRVANARNDGLFTPIGFSDVIHMPGNNGGSNSGSTRRPRIESATGAASGLRRVRAAVERQMTWNGDENQFCTGRPKT